MELEQTEILCAWASPTFSTGSVSMETMYVFSEVPTQAPTAQDHYEPSAASFYLATLLISHQEASNYTRFGDTLIRRRLLHHRPLPV